jgi:ribose transport system substrate-binding protein
VVAVQKANDAQVPIIALDRAANGGTLASYIASNNVNAGKPGAQLVAHSSHPGA